MSYCSHCGSSNKPSSKFCNNCGALLIAPSDVRCAICGTANNLESVYCSTCGGRLDSHPPVQTGKVDTLSSLPNPPPEMTAHAWPVAEAEDDAGDEIPPSQQQPPGRRMPEWISRLQPAAPDEPINTPPPVTEIGHQKPGWLRELHAANTAEGAPGEEPSENRGDWLANLRAAAMIELEAGREEPGKSDVEAGPTPIPRWFAYIRPPLASAPRSTARSDVPAEGEPSPGVEEAKQVPASVPSGPSTQSAGMPDWLVQLQSYPNALEQAPEPEAQIEPPKGAITFAATESEGTGDIPEWVKELKGHGPPEPPSAGSQVEQVPDGLDRPSQPTNASLGSQPGLELPLTREERLGLPDWLASPLESEQLLPRQQTILVGEPPSDVVVSTSPERDMPARESERPSEARDLDKESSLPVGEVVGTTHIQDAAPLAKPDPAANSIETGGRQAEGNTPKANPTEISALHSRMAQRIAEMQRQLQIMLERLGTTQDQGTPPAMPKHETLKMQPIVSPFVPESSEEPAEQSLARETPGQGVIANSTPQEQRSVGPTASEQLASRDTRSGSGQSEESRPVPKEVVAEPHAEQVLFKQSTSEQTFSSPAGSEAAPGQRTVGEVQSDKPPTLEPMNVEEPPVEAGISSYSGQRAEPTQDEVKAPGIPATEQLDRGEASKDGPGAGPLA